MYSIHYMKAITATIQSVNNRIYPLVGGPLQRDAGAFRIAKSVYVRGGLKYFILSSSCERIALENDSECASRETVSAPNGEPRGRQAGKGRANWQFTLLARRDR